MTLLDLQTCTAAYSPTAWQLSQYPAEYQYKLATIFDGIDRTFWQRRSVPRRIGNGPLLSDQTRIVTYVARGFEAIRGFDIFMMVAKRICEARRDVVFAVVGTDTFYYGEDLKYIRAPSFREYVLSQDRYDLSRFVFTGAIQPPQLVELLSLSDLHIYLTVPYVLSWSLVLLFIVFQDDIRRMLTQVGTGPLYTRRDRVAQNQAVEEMVKAVTHLASRRVGAPIVLQHEVGLNEYIDVGTRLDARVSRELVTSIFLPDSPIHDGALIIQNGRITAAGCFLPLTANPNVSKTLGTRHRAAIGLTEETDAVVIAVSEEDGTISLAREGKITRDIDGATLRTTLQRLLVE